MFRIRKLFLSACSLPFCRVPCVECVGSVGANVGAFREASFSPWLWFNTSSDRLNLCLLYCEEILEFTCTFVQAPSTLSYSFNKPYHGIHTPAVVFSLLWSCVFVTVKNVGVKVPVLTLHHSTDLWWSVFDIHTLGELWRFKVHPNATEHVYVCVHVYACVSECVCPRYWSGQDVLADPPASKMCLRFRTWFKG